MSRNRDRRSSTDSLHSSMYLGRLRGRGSINAHEDEDEDESELDEDNSNLDQDENEDDEEVPDLSQPLQSDQKDFSGLETLGKQRVSRYQRSRMAESHVPSSFDEDSIEIPSLRKSSRLSKPEIGHSESHSLHSKPMSYRQSSKDIGSFNSSISNELPLFQAYQGTRLTRLKKNELLSNSVAKLSDKNKTGIFDRSRNENRTTRFDENISNDGRSSGSVSETPDVIDDESTSSSDDDAFDHGRKYSFRNRELVRRETLNIQSLGGDGGSYAPKRSGSKVYELRQPSRTINSTDASFRPTYREASIPKLYHSSRNSHSNRKISRKRHSGQSESYYGNISKPSSSLNRRSRQHFDSSSESSEDGSPRKSSHKFRGSQRGGVSEDADFSHYEEQRLQREMDSILPINQTNGLGGSTHDQISHRDIAKADANPVAVDSSIGFASVGGLDGHIHSLKEMIVLPLLYPEVFTRFDTQPPRGVLFVGPPGTGKTLTARALANSLSGGHKIGDRKVSFFMRKGADCLSKWVGEGERQLRLLFEQAKKFQPSIIFFDEIDGLAPVRSVKQDQIHASIVSTLLALMDGLDSRGQVVVIGATNRPDAIDSALRRPGRFDRELLFSLPDASARKVIIDIHTKNWSPPLMPDLKEWIVERTAGYCGADLKALCAEASLIALKRSYPQIYESSVKLDINSSAIKLSMGDFAAALCKIIPSSQRSVNSAAKPLDATMKPLLDDSLSQIRSILMKVFPPINKKLSSSTFDILAINNPLDPLESANELLKGWACQESDSWTASLADAQHSIETSQALMATNPSGSSNRIQFQSYWDSSRRVTLPRTMIIGVESMGQMELACATLHYLEAFPSVSLDYASLVGDQFASSPEQALVNKVHEAIKIAPCIIFMPNFFSWWSSASESLRLTLISVLESIPQALPVLWVSTLTIPASLMRDDPEARDEIDSTLTDNTPACISNIQQFIQVSRAVELLAGVSRTNAVEWLSKSISENRIVINPMKALLELASYGTGTYKLEAPSKVCRANLYGAFFNHFYSLPAKVHKAMRQLWIAQTQVLSIIQPEDTVTSDKTNGLLNSGDTSFTVDDHLLKAVDATVNEGDQQCQREIRTFFRATLSEIYKEKRCHVFWRPVDPEMVSDYYDVIKNPMDLETMRVKVDEHKYPTYGHFLRDLHQIIFNAKEYNPMTSKDQRGRSIVHAANSLIDMVEGHAYHFKGELGYDVFARCDDVARRNNIRPPYPLPKPSDLARDDNEKYYYDILRIHNELKEEDLKLEESRALKTSRRSSKLDKELSVDDLDDERRRNRIQMRKAEMIEEEDLPEGRRRSCRGRTTFGDLEFISLDDIQKPRCKKSRVSNDIDGPQAPSHQSSIELSTTIGDYVVSSTGINDLDHLEQAKISESWPHEIISVPSILDYCDKADVPSNINSVKNDLEILVTEAYETLKEDVMINKDLSVGINSAIGEIGVKVDLSSVDVEEIPLIKALKWATAMAEKCILDQKPTNLVERMIACTDSWDVATILDSIMKFNRVSHEFHIHGDWNIATKEIEDIIVVFETQF